MTLRASMLQLSLEKLQTSCFSYTFLPHDAAAAAAADDDDDDDDACC